MGKRLPLPKKKQRKMCIFLQWSFIMRNFNYFVSFTSKMLLTFCSKCIWGEVSSSFVQALLIAIYTQSWKETSNGFKMGFTFAIWRGYIAPRLSLTIALSFYNNFSRWDAMISKDCNSVSAVQVTKFHPYIVSASFFSQCWIGLIAMCVCVQLICSI